MVSKFLTGGTSHHVGEILEMWLKSPSGLPDETHLERQLLYSTQRNYYKIQYARPAITSFAMQLVCDKAVEEMRQVVKKDGGLHTFTTCRSNTLTRHDPGPDTFTEVMKLYQLKMPVLWGMLLSLAGSDEKIGRERRSPELVCC